MVGKSGKKQPCLAIAVTLVFAVFGTFVFSIAGISHAIAMGENKPYSPSSKGIYTSVNHTIDWLTVETKTVSRASRSSFSPLRNVLQRELMFLERFYANEYLTVLSIQSANPNHFLNNKDTIQLKLRI